MPPRTLFFYLARRMLLSVLVLSAGLAAFLSLTELIDDLRYLEKVRAGNYGVAALLTLMRAPASLLALSPFTFLFGAMWTFSQLSRRAELSVMRAAGLSIWRVLGPAAFVATAAGVVLVLAADPIASGLLGASEKLKLELRGRTSSLVEVFGDGVWLRQRDGDKIFVINARSFDAKAGRFDGVTMLRFDLNQKFLERIEAPTAFLNERTLELRDVTVRAASETVVRRTPTYAIAAALKVSDIRDNASRPETISIWRLPRLILLSEAAGLPSLPYGLRFHDLCATPLKLAAMVLIAGLFSVAPHRSGRTMQLALAGVATGFSLFVLSKLSNALGLSGYVPVSLAAWIPALVATLVAVWALLQAEEG